MIELPADLAEVLKTVRSEDAGATAAFPDGDEDQLLELAEAWDAWNRAADPQVRAIVASARQAAAHMSGEAADSFQQYLEKYAGREDAHAVTTLEIGLAMARCLRGASDTVARAKSAMVLRLRTVKEHLDGGALGAVPDAAGRSQVVGPVADACRRDVRQASADIASMLRGSAGVVERMDDAGQVCELAGAGGRGGPATGAADGAPVAGPAAGTAGTAGAVRPALAGAGTLGEPRTGFASAEVPGPAGGVPCRPGAVTTPGLDLAGFAGAVGEVGGAGGVGGVGGPVGAGGVAGVDAAPEVRGVGASSGSSGMAGRARGVGPTGFRGAGPGATLGAGAGTASGRTGTVGQSAPGTRRQLSASGTVPAAGAGAGRGAGPASAGGAGAGGAKPGAGLPGGGRGAGKKRSRAGRRAGLVGQDLPEDEAAVADSGVLGRPAEVVADDRRARRAHRRWLDQARTDAGPPDRAGAPPARGQRDAEAPEPADDLVTKLAGVVLGPRAGAAGGAEGSGGLGAGAGAAAAGAGAGAGAGVGPVLRSEAGRADGGPPGGAPAGPDAAAQPVRLREEGGYRVPSPKLRAALAKLAAAGEFDKPAPASASAGRPTAPAAAPGPAQIPEPAVEQAVEQATDQASGPGSRP
ncbi:hypothetical protein OG689_30015 [Kitasatospora sp. NBC_00240]|uniref:WXG100-like domain-containing protein n=1 Tax=Kitasatospora sp. NBC_00240 TaxID=2903567 RepID=UPI0022582E8C|nr:hypothetical protein [Kitasatospora sp. NBC_00240]MCX5213454.1 hypothetical protein [Kitasatospora sp. NBC_00240]